MTMEPLLKDILTAAGVDTSSATTRDAWNDFVNPSSDTCMESLAPLSSNVYQALARLFLYAWNSPISLSQTSTTSLSEEEEEHESSLESQVQAVQVTQWLRNMADFNVGEDSSFSYYILQESKQSEELLQALFHHISSLPLLQQDIYYQAQQLRQVTSRQYQNVSSRLEHYQATQRYTETLLQQLQQHILQLEWILGEWYLVGSTDVRTNMRKLLAKIWQDFIKQAPRPLSTKTMENTTACGISMTLRFLLRILQGSCSHDATNVKSQQHLLFYTLIPLHQPSSMVLWRDQTCLLDLYHEPLVQCMAIILQKNVDWIPLVIQGLLATDVWSRGNTPKIVLLLHEIDTLIQMGTVDIWKEHFGIFQTLLLRLAQCSSSDNSRMAERALQLFRNMTWCELVYQTYSTSVPILLRALVQRDVPWNPTVRKMTHVVLQQLRDYNEQEFAVAAQEVFGNHDHDTAGAVSIPVDANKEEDVNTDVTMQESASPETSRNETTIPTTVTTPKPSTTTTQQPSISSSRFSLKAGMGEWRPPRTSAPAHAKYSLMGPPKARPPQKGNTGAAAPPLTITGVAPWATSSGSSTEGAALFGHKRNAGQAHLNDSKQMPPPPSSVAAIIEEETIETENEAGLQRILTYMTQLKPDCSSNGENDDDDGTSPWAKAQMAETPTLLPSLKFHDLVFGHDLGKGAFGTVKYARRIEKSTTRSHWAEFAVKIISTAKIVEMGYEASVQREIATLRVLSHPCIARLVSSFRFGDGAYLVLEYASGGDLHSLLSNQGSLDEDSTRFVIGEITSALASIHDLGFVYADLKPENVLITETGHLKLTDFGGCRPLTEAAKELIRPSGMHLLKELRDGDWKERPKETGDNDEEMEDVSDAPMDEEEDLRIEGTTAYLPPEVVMGESPTAAADSWALGCVMYQCLSGRPPLLDNDEHATKQKIVTFHMDKSHKQPEDSDDPLFRDAHAFDIAPNARRLIRKLLSPREERPNMIQVSEDPFFEGTNIFHLHREPAVPLDVGTVAPVEDATWSRRQYSSIWAPQPKAYDISLPQSVHFSSNPMLASKTPIPEGDERNVFFSWRSMT